jgi:dinuclear metal center YbgI/SA1388 family protein
MATVADIAEVLGQLAPLRLAESWDNVGLLIGDARWPVRRVMVCLTVTPQTVAEAISQGAQLIVSHHPLPFKPLATVTADSTPGRLMLELIGNSVAVYSAHTAFDSAQAGINQHLAIGLGLQEIRPLVAIEGADDEEGTGRFGMVDEPLSLDELAARAKAFLNINEVRVVGPPDHSVSRVAMACGSGGLLLADAVRAGCDAMLTGEANFHTCLEAQSQGVGLVMPGHFASERFAMLSLADYLSDQVADAEFWASQHEADPLRRV